MKRFAILFLCTICLGIAAHAQTFTQHLQQTQPGNGKVTVTQSKEIDNLVNGINQTTKTVANTTTTPYKENITTHQSVEKPSLTEKKATTTQNTEKRQEIAEKKALATEKKAEATAKEPSTEDDIHIPTVDMRKKVMRGSRKITGYRVQAYAGGNTRADKVRAQQIGEAIKIRYPDQPVYVHFYSPRWICRVGNYRTYGEAEYMLKAIKAMGYKSATIVKGKITVFE